MQGNKAAGEEINKNVHDIVMLPPVASIMPAAIHAGRAASAATKQGWPHCRQLSVLVGKYD